MNNISADIYVTLALVFIIGIAMREELPIIKQVLSYLF